MTAPVDTVDAYLAGLTPLRRQRLSDLRALVDTVAPDVGDTTDLPLAAIEAALRTKFRR